MFLCFVGGLVICGRIGDLWEDSNLRKRAKRLIVMARPERFELPTTWFEARYPTVVFFPYKRNDYCGLVYKFLPILFSGLGLFRPLLA